jgi:acetone carboxylase alpha subunit
MTPKEAQAEEKEFLKERLERSRRLLEETGCCFGIENLTLKKQDPLKYEIFHARIQSTVISARNNSMLISSNLMVREMGELSFALFTPEGDSVVFSTGIMIHIGLMGKFIKWMIDHDYEVTMGFKEGDHFACNDWKIANVHAPDIYFATPIFYQGEIAGWAAGVTHSMDTGSLLGGGGMSVSITERPMEGFHVAARKVCENDELRPDWVIDIQNNIRLASHWLLDDKARINGNVYIREEVKKIIDEFGLVYFQHAMRELVEEGRQHHLARVKQKMIPGRYRRPSFGDLLLKGNRGIPPYADRDYILHIPNEVFIEPSGRWVVNLEGVSPEGFHALHAPPNAVIGAMNITIVQILEFDGRGNVGSIQDIEFRLPPGSIVNPQNPFVATSYSWGTLHSLDQAWLTIFSRAFYCRGYLEEVLLGGFTSGDVGSGGINQYGVWYGGVTLEPTGGGSGARGVMDGIDTAWVDWNMEGDQGNAEMWECFLPYLYLGRGILIDTGAPGRYRGGSGAYRTWMIHNSNFVWPVPFGSPSCFYNNFSMCGGYGAAPQYYNLALNTDLNERIEKKLPLPNREKDPRYPALTMLKGDVRIGLDMAYAAEPLKTHDLLQPPIMPGGCAFGDPIEREPRSVECDLSNGFVSNEVAEKVYGVVASFDESRHEWHVHLKATEKLRQDIRQQRLKRGIPVKEWWKQTRKRLQNEEIPPQISQMYSECKSFSPDWAKEFNQFWALE